VCGERIRVRERERERARERERERERERLPRGAAGYGDLLADAAYSLLLEKGGERECVCERESKRAGLGERAR